MNKQTLNQLINRVGKLQKKLLIIINLLLILEISVQGQNTDTVSFKKDFENLLKKYGIKSNGYQINVTSINQKGGQTALVINNNYFGDTLSGKNNIVFWIDTTNSQKILNCGPLRGIWANPFLAMDVDKFKHGVYYDDGQAGTYREVNNLTTTVNNNKCFLRAITSNNSCSRILPMKIDLSKLPAEDFVIFGDLGDISKTFLYRKGKIEYFGN